MLVQQLKLSGKRLEREKNFQRENNNHTANTLIIENEQFKRVKEEEQQLEKVSGKKSQIPERAKK